MAILEYLITLLTPDDCLVCGREGLLLCPVCLVGITPPPARCFGCDVKITAPDIGCKLCLKKMGVTELRAAAYHGGAASELVSALKFHGNRSAAHVMARTMAPVTPIAPEVLLVNVPATNQHIRQRGFDQAGLIARQISRLSGLPCRSVLVRAGKVHQFGSTKAARLQQLRGAVRVIRPSVVKDKHIILVDDVLTTGASLTASASVLKIAGARRVDAWVFARAGKTAD